MVDADNYDFRVVCIDCFLRKRNANRGLAFPVRDSMLVEATLYT